MKSESGWKLRKIRELVKDYDEIAPSYDESRFKSFGGSYIDELEKQTVIRFLEKGISLELGTGTGRYGVVLVQNDHYFIGIDISKNMLKISKAKLKNSKQASLILMDVGRLAFRPESFDNIICIHTIEYSLNPLLVIKEASKALKDGGKFVVTAESIDSMWHNIGLKLKLESYNDRRLFSQGEFVRFFQSAGFQLIFQGSLFTLPLLFYRKGPKPLVMLAKKFDKLMKKRGTILISVGQKMPYRQPGNFLNVKDLTDELSSNV